MTSWESFCLFLKKWIFGYLGIDIIMSALAKGEQIPVQAYVQVGFSVLSILLLIFTFYKAIYTLMGLFGKSKTYPEAKTDKRYAFIIAACNEEKVIGNLIDSIREMDYPQDLIEIFIVADNCTDKTGEIAKKKGAHVYYHNNPKERRKGFALHYMIEEMRKEFDLEKSFYAYTLLDADNIPAPDYLRKINNYLQASGVDECVGYRNTKNLNENWISAMCGVQSYAHVISGLRPREILGTNQETYGPSTTLRSYIVKEFGWPWTSLTEDLELMMDLTSRGYKTGYTGEAVFYEEQPTTIKLIWRQRLRWARGGLIAFQKYNKAMLKSFFKKPTWSKYDIYWQVFPYSFVTFWLGFLYQITSIILFLCIGNSGYYNWNSFINYIITMITGSYLGGFFTDLITIIREWKHFLLPLWKTVAYMLLFPLYGVIDPFFAAISAFIKPQWKHIDHHSVKSSKNLREMEYKKMYHNDKKKQDEEIKSLEVNEEE